MEGFLNVLLWIGKGIGALALLGVMIGIAYLVDKIASKNKPNPYRKRKWR